MPTEEFRVSNLSHTSTLTNATAGAAKRASRAVRRRLGVVPQIPPHDQLPRAFMAGTRRDKEGFTEARLKGERGRL